MKPSQIRCPRCFAPRSVACVTENGIERPMHAERIELATRRTSEAVEAGVEVPEVRSARFEENEDIEVPTESVEALAEMAVEQLREVIDSAEVDEATGELVIYARTPQGLEIEERLHSFAEVHAFLGEFGFDPESEPESTEEWGFGYGGPLKLIRREIDALLTEEEVASWFSALEPTGAKLFRVSTGVLVPEVRIELAGINDELVRYLAAHPEKLYSLDPRKFEELVEAIFRDFGYDVVLTPKSKDGGLDIRATRKDSVGTLLYLIECKRYAATRPVGVDIVRGLYGVATTERASCGLIVTTSHFTRGAKEFADKVKYQMSLRDYSDLVNWLGEYPRSKSRGR
jgi:hypothetical protein